LLTSHVRSLAHTLCQRGSISCGSYRCSAIGNRRLAGALGRDALAAVRWGPLSRSGEARAGAQRLYDGLRRLGRRAGVERRPGVVLDAQLDRLGDLRAGDPRRQRQRHVDARRDARAGDELAVEDHALMDRPASPPSRPSRSKPSQWVVAPLPSSSPAAASTSEPVQTDVVHSLISFAVLSHSSTPSPARAATSPGPPGTRTMSPPRTSASERSATTVSMPLSVVIGPRSAARKARLTPGRRLSTSYGPIASRAVKRS